MVTPKANEWPGIDMSSSYRKCISLTCSYKTKHQVKHVQKQNITQINHTLSMMTKFYDKKYLVNYWCVYLFWLTTSLYYYEHPRWVQECVGDGSGHGRHTLRCQPARSRCWAVEVRVFTYAYVSMLTYHVDVYRSGPIGASLLITSPQQECLARNGLHTGAGWAWWWVLY